jgi:hypothetical protein
MDNLYLLFLLNNALEDSKDNMVDYLLKIM